MRRSTFNAPVVFSEGGSPSAPTYRFQPTSTVTGPANANSPVTFENTRTATPDESHINDEGAADVKVASFNVLNYFTTLGDPTTKTSDGDALPTTTPTVTATRPHGLRLPRRRDPEDLARQQEKIVAAINALDADVVGLRRSRTPRCSTGTGRDEATRDAGRRAQRGRREPSTWACEPSSADLPDVARWTSSGTPSSTSPPRSSGSGESRAMGELSGDGEAFDNAREPLAQGFAPAAGGEEFPVVVNHFKSKGSGGRRRHRSGQRQPGPGRPGRGAARLGATVCRTIGDRGHLPDR